MKHTPYARDRMNYREILNRDPPMEQLGFHRDFVIAGKSNAAVIKAARKHVRSMDRFRPTDFSVQVSFSCGHTQIVNLTKSAIKRRRWMSVVQHVIDHGCYHCYQTASAAVEGARKEVMRLLREGQVTTLIEAAERATDDLYLRLAVYDRVAHWQENPLTVSPSDLALLTQRTEPDR
jgi:hypothetical protein